MSQDLQTGLSALIAAIVGWVVSQLLGKKSPTPANPVAPVKPAEPPMPDSGNDPYAGMPGLPGHPFLRIIVPGLLRWLGGSVQATTSPPAPATAALSDGQSVAHDEAALTLIASAVKSDPKRLAKMKMLLSDGQ